MLATEEVHVFAGTLIVSQTDDWPIDAILATDIIVCYTATRPFLVLRDDTKNGRVADYWY